MPQPRGEVPDRNARRLIEAMIASKAAQIERDEAIVAALKAGGSSHQVARIIGMAQSHVYTIGKAGGWPTERAAVSDRREAQGRR